MRKASNDGNDETLIGGGALTSRFPIGPYQLVQLLGEGGMGEVWRAEQVHPIQRTVALKLIKAGMDTRALVARFESERQALALMDHPNIAKVFDAGASATGRPYFVMEYVPGLPITTYCDKHRLTIRERISLFVQVCEGVQHAHQKGIIHRDLKPSNVLVSEVDDKAIPKVIDFGLAKAMGQRLTDMTLLTEVGDRVGTPAYMSPEQASRNESSIDTRTDVYSLGVMIYELLVGSLPFEWSDRQGSSTVAMLETLSEREPPRPSTRFKLLGPSSGKAAVNRGEDAKSLYRHVRGELDWITIKALEKERSRRYASCSELAADLRRFLEDQPVLAGPPSTRYRVSKFVRRHRSGVIAAATGVALLLAFAISMALQARRISVERDRANREAETSRRVSQFMTDMFKVSDPGEARGSSITARDILDKGSRDIETGLAKNPEVQAQMMAVMGGVYENLGLYAQAEDLLSRAVDIRRRVLTPDDPETLRSAVRLATIFRDEGKYADAEKLQRDTLPRLKRVLGGEHPDTLACMRGLSAVLYYEGRTKEAEELGKRTLDVELRVEGAQNPATLGTMINLASAYFDQGRFQDAEKLYREAFDGRRRTLGSNHPDTLSAMDGYATTLAAENRLGASEQLLRQVLAARQNVLGPEHRDTLMSMNNLSTLLALQGRFAEAEKLERQTVEIQKRVLGPNHPDTAMSTYNLGSIALKNKSSDQALQLLRSAVDHGLAPNIALQMESDPDLAALHGDPRFTALIDHAKAVAAGARQIK
jgi:non-specific serine/threonine protein kinase/serine/threonine-protein kinase